MLFRNTLTKSSHEYLILTCTAAQLYVAYILECVVIARVYHN